MFGWIDITMSTYYVRAICVAILVQLYTTGGQTSCVKPSEMTALKLKLIEFEGIHYKAYDAQPKSKYVDWTICVGFNLNRKDARDVFRKVLPNVDFDAVYAGNVSLNKNNCMDLLEFDLTNIYIPRAADVSGSDKFCSLPENVKIAVVDAVYRGDLKYDHKTAKYMRAGEWCKVPAEYLNNNDYIHCKERGLPGVCKRMKWNADQFQTMCKTDK